MYLNGKMVDIDYLSEVELQIGDLHYVLRPNGPLGKLLEGKDFFSFKKFVYF